MFLIIENEENFQYIPETFAAWRKLFVAAGTPIDAKKIVEQFKYQLLLQKSDADFVSGDKITFISRVDSLLKSPIEKLDRSVFSLFSKVFKSMLNAKNGPDVDNGDVIILDVGQPDSEVMDKNKKEKIPQNTPIGNNNKYVNIYFSYVVNREDMLLSKK